MLCKWPAIREKEVYFIRKLAKLKTISEDIKLKVKNFKTPVVIKKRVFKINQNDIEGYKANEVVEKK